MSVNVFMMPVILAGTAIYEIGVAAGLIEEVDGPTFRFETPMKRMDLLCEAIQNLGQKVKRIESGKVCVFKTSLNIFDFYTNENGCIIVDFSGLYSKEEAEEFVTNVTQQYSQLIQQKVYENLKQKAETKGLIFEDEEVEEDNSITLTFTIQE